MSDEYINDFCASFQASVVDCIVNRLTNAMGDVRVMNAKPKTLVVAGGVAKNSAIRSAMEQFAKKQKHNLLTTSYKTGFLCGVVQGIAVLPGLSRSGATICFLKHRGTKNNHANNAKTAEKNIIQSFLNIFFIM